MTRAVLEPTSRRPARGSNCETVWEPPAVRRGGVPDTRTRRGAVCRRSHVALCACTLATPCAFIPCTSGESEFVSTIHCRPPLGTSCPESSWARKHVVIDVAVVQRPHGQRRASTSTQLHRTPAAFLERIGEQGRSIISGTFVM
jgi:hypothetical protein